MNCHPIARSVARHAISGIRRAVRRRALAVTVAAACSGAGVSGVAATFAGFPFAEAFAPADREHETGRGQGDDSSRPVAVDEPDSVALLGGALVIAGLLGRRRA